MQPSDAFTSSLAVITPQRDDCISNEEDLLDYLFVLFCFFPPSGTITRNHFHYHDATAVVAALTSNDIVKLDIEG